ncbi:MAG: pyridoxamine 5'-phosphate oxidase family protein [Nitrospinae bacterium]|nr:pyridoxamine 5'-phosphate oxidase family protein [Nitrospinota bacterium]
MEQTTAASKIETKEELREFYGPANERSVKKQMAKLDEHAKNFIALSPFMVISSATAEGADASPKGDPPGFVKVIDDNTLIIPDRPGNNRVDTMSNIMESNHVGLLFLVPGMCETLRVNGRARITTDPEILEPHSVKGKLPRSAMIIDVDDVYLHCAKALIRADLWNAEKHIERKSFPSMGQMLADQIDEDGYNDGEEMNKGIQERYKTGLY